MFDIVRIDSNFPIEKVIRFCEYSHEDPLPGNVNFFTNDWEINTNTLLFLLYKEKRYDSDLASYIGLMKDNELVAAAGYYPLEQDHNVAIINSRYYTIPTFRNKVLQGQYILPQMMKEIGIKFKVALFSYNHYNVWLKNALDRINKNRAAFLGTKTPIEYKGWIELSTPLLIKNVAQLCYYKLFDQSYEQDFLHKIDKIRIY